MLGSFVIAVDKHLAFLDNAAVQRHRLGFTVLLEFSSAKATANSILYLLNRVKRGRWRDGCDGPSLDDMRLSSPTPTLTTLCP